MTLSCGQCAGWATINYNDLQDKNSTFPTGPLTEGQLSFMISIVNGGGFVGNFGILPLIQLLGVKRTIHCLGAILLVRIEKLFI